MEDTIKDTLDKYFKTREKTAKESLNKVALYIYYLESKNNQSDLFLLAHLLPEEYLMKLINYFSGDTLKLPTRNEFVDCYLLAVCFYLKEVENWDWKMIKDFIPLSEPNKEILSSISLGRKINTIKENMTIEIKNILNNIKEKDFRKLLREDFYG